MMTGRNVPLRGIADSTKRESAPPAIAKVAVARKLAIRLYIMLRDGIDYEEFCRRGPEGSGRGSHAGMLGDVALV
jgi:hypothetical protein